jgi:HK97 gp10 family phage protein
VSFKQEYSGVWRGEEVKIRGKRVIGKTTFEAGLIVEGNSKTLCPVDSGRLAGSITVQSKFNGTIPTGEGSFAGDLIQKPVSDFEVYVGTPVFYAPYIEYGTVDMEPQSFLRPALDMAKGRTLTIFMDNGRAQFKEYMRVA